MFPGITYRTKIYFFIFEDQKENSNSSSKILNQTHCRTQFSQTLPKVPFPRTFSMVKSSSVYNNDKINNQELSNKVRKYVEGGCFRQNTVHALNGSYLDCVF